MNIDMAALHAIEADKGITVDVVVETIKSALLTAYRHTEGHEPDARIDIDRKTGVVKVIARQTDADGNVVKGADGEPEMIGWPDLAARPDFAAAILDFLCESDERLLHFARSAGFRPERIAYVRAALEAGQVGPMRRH